MLVTGDDTTRAVVPDFDEGPHVFSIDGREIPSVTYILRSAGIGHQPSEDGYTPSDEVMERARERGIAVHQATEYLDTWGAVEQDWEDGDEPDWWPYLLAYQQFLDETGFCAERIEQPVYCAEYDYAGIVDRMGWIGDEKVVLDIKTGPLKAWHGPQTAAYAYAIEGEQWLSRIILELRPQQKRKRYKITRLSPQSAEWDFKVFLAARTLLTFRELHGLAA